MWFRALFWVLLFSLAACGDDGGAGSGSAKNGEAEGREGASGVPTLTDHRTHLDLLALAHLADVVHRGLFIDFGTPARMKYTVGHWRTEWGTDGSSGDTSYTHAGRRGRIFFHLDKPEALTIRLRLRPVGATVVSPYVNGEGIELVRFEEGSGFRDYDIKVPADKVVRGDNQLMLVFGDTTKVGDEDVAVAVESVRVIPASATDSGEYVPPTYDSLVAEVKVDGKSRRALAVRRPSSLRYHIEVPPEAKLSFSVALEGKGEADVHVRVHVDGSDPVEVYGEKVGAQWTDAIVDLAPFRGQVVRLDFDADGEGPGRVAWGTPGIMVPKVEAEKPGQVQNVVVLLIDTLRASKLKVYNPESPVKTPHLAAVAKEGTVFERAQAPENWTKPSCASILTSLYPASHGAKTDAARLPSSALMISEHLKAKGFKTGSFIANGYVSGKFGFDQGWDHYTNYIRENKSTEAESVFKEAGDWIEANKGERFFAYIQTIDPHVPYDPPEQYLKMYDARDDYDGQVKPRMTAQLLADAKKSKPTVTFSASDKKRLEALHHGEITYHDDEMGKFVARMKKLGLWDNTLFVITADHGEEFGEHGSWGHGHSTYQELLHVPLIFRSPGVVPSGKRVPYTVSTLDIGPTVLELAGVDSMPKAEGQSLLGYMAGRIPARPSVAFSDFLDDHRVIRAGRWKLILRGLTVDFFDLEKDPGEQNDLGENTAPIAFRYMRVMLGTFLGASDRGRWLDAGQNAGTRFHTEEVAVDPETRDQLRALGYAN